MDIRCIATAAGFSIRPETHESDDVIFFHFISNRSSPTVDRSIYLPIGLRQLGQTPGKISVFLDIAKDSLLIHHHGGGGHLLLRGR